MTSPFRYLHFAVPIRLFPENSALELHNPDETGDGLLWTSEIATWKPLSTELVVLSPMGVLDCGVAQTSRAVTLGRAFLSQGAGSVLSPLWQVSQRETGDLLARFYEEVLRGKSKAVALRSAKLGALDRQLPGSTNSAVDTRHPSFWAVPILEGDPR